MYPLVTYDDSIKFSGRMGLRHATWHALDSTKSGNYRMSTLISRCILGWTSKTKNFFSHTRRDQENCDLTYRILDELVPLPSWSDPWKFSDNPKTNEGNFSTKGICRPFLIFTDSIHCLPPFLLPVVEQDLYWQQMPSCGSCSQWQFPMRKGKRA